MMHESEATLISHISLKAAQVGQLRGTVPNT